eukprot:4910589-Amphidinium_carterae.1
MQRLLRSLPCRTNPWRHVNFRQAHRRGAAWVYEQRAHQELQHRSAPKNYLQHLPLLAAEIVCGFLGPPRGFEESIELQTANWCPLWCKARDYEHCEEHLYTTDERLAARTLSLL